MASTARIHIPIPGTPICAKCSKIIKDGDEGAYIAQDGGMMLFCSKECSSHFTTAAKEKAFLSGTPPIITREQYVDAMTWLDSEKDSYTNNKLVDAARWAFHAAYGPGGKQDSLLGLVNKWKTLGYGAFSECAQQLEAFINQPRR